MNRLVQRRFHLVRAGALLAFALLCAGVNPLSAQFTYSEDFKGSAAPGWNIEQRNTSPGPRLTGGTTPLSVDPESGQQYIDPAGSGWLRLTTATNQQANAVYFDAPIPAAGNEVKITFNMNMWGGSGADGITMFLYDASQPFQTGAFGGSLGYAQKDQTLGGDETHAGLIGGYVGIAFDRYGNFSAATEGRIGGLADRVQNSVAARGPWDPTNGLLGYEYLDGSVAPYSMGVASAARPNQSTQYRKVEFILDENNQATVRMQFGEDGLWYTMLTVDLSSFARPEALRLGFSAGTGGLNQVAEIGGMLQVNATAGSGNFVWDNDTVNSLWGTGASDPINWHANTNPTLKSNVMFNSSYISSPQSINATGSDKVVGNLYFSGPNAYTLSSTESRRLIFDNNTAGGVTAISITPDVAGDASHTVGMGVQLNKTLEVINILDAAHTFSITGNIELGANTLGVRGSGTTVLSGAISGTGALVKSGDGTTIIGGTLTNTFSGGTTINAGTLQLEKASALGANTGQVMINAGGTLALGGAGATFAANPLTLNGTGVGDAGALNNIAGNNTWSGTVRLGSASTIGAAADTSLNISGVVSNTGTLTKVGAGSLTLSGANTYTGATNVIGGTLAISNENNLGANPGAFNAAQLNLDGGTLRTYTSAVTINDANRGVTIGAGGGTIDTQSNLTLATRLSGAGTLTKSGSGTFTLSASNTHTGDVLINAGTLAAQGGSALGDNAAVTIAAGGTLSTAGASETVGSIGGAGNLGLGSTGTTLFTTGGNNQSTTFSGVISGGAGNSVAKAGTGTLTLSGASTLAGNLTVAGGSVALQNGSGQALGNVAAITVNAGTVLELGAANQINDSANLVLAGGTFANNGFSETMRQLSQTAASTVDYLDEGGVLRFNGVAGSVSGLGTITGTLSIANWAGSIDGGGTEQLVVYSPSGAPAVTNLTFTDWGAATTIARNDLGTGYYEVIPSVSSNARQWNVDSASVQNWGVASNWSSPTVPNASNAIAILGNTVDSVPLNNNITISLQTTNRTIGKLIFENDANRSYTVGNGTSGRLSFDVSSGSAQIIVNDDGSHTLAADSLFNDSLTISNNSSAAAGLTISGGLSQEVTGTRTLTFNGTGTTVVNGVITDRRGTTNLLKTGTGTLVLGGTANNTYEGGTTVRSGTLQLNKNGALGSGTVTVNDSSTTGGMNTAVLIGATNVTANRTFSIGTQGGTTTLGGATSLQSGSGTFSGTVTFAKDVTLNASGTSTITFSGALTDAAGIAGTRALTKTGSGTVVLGGSTTNVGAGALNIHEGTLEVAKTVTNAAIGDASAVDIAAGALLRLNNGRNETIGSLAGAGTLDNANATGLTLTVGGNNSSTSFSGVIQDSGGTLALVKSGSGTLTLAGSNTYAGSTAISAGTLTVQNTGALGNAGAATTTTVASGATLALDFGGTQTIANENLTLNGTGVGANGALRNLAGNTTWSGTISLENNSEIQSDAGTLTIGGTVQRSGTTSRALTLDGNGDIVVSGTIANTITSLTKNGTGTTVLSADNAFTGAVSVNAGTMEIRNADALGDTGAATATTVSNGATLALAGSTYVLDNESLTVAGQGANGTGAISNRDSAHTISGNIALSADASFGATSGTTLTASGVVSGAFSLTKVDAGTVVLSNANTYTGSTAISAGTLQLTGAGTVGSSTHPVTVADGATLAFDSLTTARSMNISLLGSGVGGAGAIRSIAGTNTLTGNLYLTGDTTVGVTAGTLTASGILSGGHDLVKAGDGTLVLAGSANTYTGTTTLRNGTLTVIANAPATGNGSLGSSSSAVQIGDAGTSAGALAFQIGSATGGVSVDRPIAVNNFGGTVTLAGTNTSGTNTFGGDIALAKNITASAAAGGTVAFNGAVSGVGGVTSNSASTGTVVLAGDNTYGGTTTVSGGTLVAAHDHALGSSGNGTVVNAGATLGLQGGISIANESVTVTGSASPTVAALSNRSDTNSLTGPVTITGAINDRAIISSTAGTLILGPIGQTGGAKGITTSGAGNIVLSGANTFSGPLVLNGSAGANVTLGGGALLAGVNAITINSGNTFALGGNNQINNSANLILAGGTFNVGSFSATMNQLSQTVTGSTIDYLNDGSVLRFNAAGLGSITGTLYIANWAGSLTGSGTEQLVVYSPSGAPNVSGFNFAGWGAGTATTISRGDLGTGYYEILPGVSAIDWNFNGNGTWATGTNWVGNSAPNTIGAIARLGNLGSAGPLTTNPIVSLQAAATVGTLIFDNAANRNYQVTSSNGSALTFDVNSGSATIIVNDNGSHTIGVSTRFNDALTITNNSSAATGLTVSGNLNQNVAGTQTLTVTGTGQTLVSGIIDDPTGTTNLLKTGSGVLTLSGANTYAGTTTLRNGVLELKHASALGSGTSAVTVNDASTTGSMNTALLLGSANLAFARNLTVGAQGATTTLGGSFTSGTSTFSGTVTLNKSITLTAAGTSVVNFSGRLIDGTGTTNLTKTGTGTVVLGNATNNYDGSTTVSEGTLRLGAAGAVPNTSAVAVASGATFDANSLTSAVGSLAGAGNTILGTANTTTFTTGANNTGTTYSGVISGAASNAFIKTGTGTMTLSGGNLYAGTTTVTGGVLVAANANALGTTAGNTTVNTGATLGLQGGITVAGEQLTLAAATNPSTASLVNFANANTWTGNLSITGATANDQVKMDVASGTQLTISGEISQATNTKGLTKAGAGTLLFSGANKYDGLTNVAVGTLVAGHNTALGSTLAGTTVQSGATLGFQNNVQIGSGEAITLYGMAAPPSAASLRNLQDNNTVNGNITLSGGTNTGVAIESTSGSLILNGVIAQASHPNYLIKTGAGSLTLGGTAANTFSGGFTMNDGTVIAAKTAGVDATGSAAVNIGDDLGAAGSAELRLNASNQINNSSDVTIATDGRLNLQANSDSIAALTMGGGSVTGTGTLTVGSTVTFNGVGSATASISSSLGLGTTGTRIIQVGNNGVVGDTDLLISGAILGDTASLTKTDLGTLELSGTAANTFSGAFNLHDGQVTASKTAGLNAFGTGNLNIGNADGAANSAVLQLSSSNQISDGSHVTISADGLLRLNGASETIGSVAGTGGVTLNGGTLTIGGSTNLSSTFAGGITGTGDLAKGGTGTLTLTGDNTYSGSTTIHSGVLQVGTGGTSGGVGTGAVVNNGSLILNRSNTYNLEGSISGSGSLTQAGSGTTILSGTNTYTGATTINSGTLRLGADNAGPASSNVTLTAAGTALDVDGRVAEVGSIAGVTGSTVALGSGSLTVGGSCASTTYAGTISGVGGALTKTGNGTLTLSGNNTYTGPTNLNGGTLRISSDAQLGLAPSSSAADNINFNGGTLATTATMTLDSDRGIAVHGNGGTINVANDTTLSFGGTITGPGELNLALNGTGTFSLTSDLDWSSGTLSLSGGTFRLAGVDFSVGTFHITGNTILDFGSGLSSTFTAANLIVDAGVTVTVRNWINGSDYFLATNSFVQNGGASAVHNVRGTAPQNQFVFDSFSGNSTAWLNHGEISPVPEPSTYGLIFLGGCVGFFAWRRWRLQGSRRA